MPRASARWVESLPDARHVVTQHWTQLRDPVATLTEAEYWRARGHQAAGPVSELVSSRTREVYELVGATHWHLTWAPGGTVLVPVVLGPEGPAPGA